MKKLILAALIIFSGNVLKAQDAAIAAPSGSFISPVSGCALTSTENVTVSIFNFGPGTVTNPMTVTYSINGGAPVSEIIAAPNIPQNASITYTFTTQANLSAGGTYTLDATISVAGDANASNNSYTGYSVVNTAASVGGVVSGTSNICKGSNSDTLTLSGHTGTVQNWESSTDGGSTWFAFSNNTVNHAYTNLTVNTQYRAIVKNGSCSSASSAPAILTIDNPTVAGAVSGAATKCSGINSGTLTSTGRTGNILKWQFSTNGGTTWTDIASTANSITYTNLTVTTRYRAQVQNGSCSTAFSSVAIITISPVSVGGTVSGGTTVCSGSNGGTLVLSGKTGTVTRWEKSINHGTSWTNIANTTTSQTYTNLTQTTYYRALVTSSPCTAAYSSVDSIVVVSSTNAGTLSASSRVCISGNSDTLQLTGYTGSVSQWEVSTDSSTFFSITNTTDTLVYTNITQKTFYRVQVQNGGCASAYSNVITINVDNVSDAGTISSPDTVCTGTNSGTISISGYTGAVQGWQYSNDQIVWTPLANTTASNPYTNLTDTTYYRSFVKNGTCPSDTSGTSTIIVDDVSVGGYVDTSANVCSGNNQDTLNLLAYTGNVIRWELSTDGGNNWQTINNTNTFLVYANLTTTTYYRAVVKNGRCSFAYSTPAILTVDPLSNAGSITGSLTVCGGSNSGSLFLSGYNGTIDDWEMSTDLGVTWSSAANFSAVLNYSNIDTTTWYRALVTSGVCSQDTSSYGILAIDQPSVGGLLTSDDTVCVVSNNGVLNLSGYTGTIQSWQVSSDNGTTWLTIANTSASQSYNNLSTTSSYQVLVKNGVCSTDTSNAITITVGTNVNAGTITGAGARMCATANSGELILTGYNGTITDWDSSVDGGFTWNSLGTSNDTVSYVNLSDTTWYRAIVTSLACGNDTVNGTVFIDPGTNGGLLASSDTVCSAANGDTLNLTGYSGTITRWEFSIDGGYTWLPSSNTSASQIYNNIVLTTQYKVFVQSGVCPVDTSNTITIFVEAPVNAGTISGSGTRACSSANNGVLVLTGYSGAINNWNSSSDGGVTWTSLATSNDSIVYINLSDTTWYNAIVTSVACGNDTTTGLVYVDQPTIAGLLSASDTVCAGINRDTLNVTGYTGTINRWEFSLDGGNIWLSSSNTTASQIYNNLAQSTAYRVLVQNGVCAVDTTNTVVINVDAASNAGTISGNVPGCENLASGNLILNGSVGSVQQWESSVDGSSWTAIVNAGTTQAYSNLTDTTWYRTIVANGVCLSDTSAYVSVIVYPKPNAAFVTDTICFGLATSFNNQSTINSGFNQFVQWSFGDGDVSMSNAPQHEYQAAGIYNATLFLTSNFGCTDTATQQLTVKNAPSPDIVANGSMQFCLGGSLTLTADTGTVTYLWSNGATTQSITVTTSGTYTLTITNTATGCSSTDSVITNVVAAPIVNAGSDTAISLGYSYQIEATANNIIIWSWSPPEGLSSTTVQNPIATPSATTEYIVTATNENGCIDQDTIKITVLTDFNVIVSNVMTPNADGYNDTWIIQNIETYPNTEVIVVNRNGQQLYQNSSYDNSWDGTNNGKQLPDGTYYYIIKFSGSDKIYKGGITIVNGK